MATLIIDYTLQFQDLMTVPLRKASDAGAAALSKLTAAARRATAQFEALAGNVKSAADDIGSAVADATKQVEALNTTLDDLTKKRTINIDVKGIGKAQRALRGLPQSKDKEPFDLHETVEGWDLPGKFDSVLSGVREVVEQQGLDGAISYLAGSAQEGTKTLQFLDQASNELGLGIGGAKESFLTLQKALNGTWLQGQATRDIFQQVAAATTVMGAPGDDVKALFEQLGEVVGNGTVSMADFGGEIGNQLPNALNIAADAMGVSREQFEKMLDAGQVSSEDFLPRFAAQLAQVAGPDLAAAQTSAAANLARFDNAWSTTQSMLSEALIPVVVEVLGWVRGLLELINQARPFIQEWGNVIGIVAVAIGGFLAVLQGAVMLTQAWTAVQEILNVVMNLNPVGLIVAAVVALGAAVLYCWNKFESFRGFIYGFAFGAMELFKGLGNVIAGAFTMDPAQLAQGVTQLMNISQKAKEGYAQGVASFQADQKPANSLGDIKKPDQLWSATGAKPAAAPKASIGLPDAKGRGSATPAASGHTNITINVQQLGQTTIHAATVQEGAQKMKAYVQAALLSVLNDANAMTTAS
ncbi:tape measure protein [Hymenobacter sp. CRA2]|uniref:tape measure protein n=1 Tax=Hymenobacter sp. CRA2 TaxID=1955620 RepID=UPI00098E977B|nr:tape measure protein [Hymenobacter sp. CRA2]OON67812.1 hypothetical protein B0919_16640 [Hymenobacter sp. CRA2]